MRWISAQTQVAAQRGGGGGGEPEQTASRLSSLSPAFRHKSRILKMSFHLSALNETLHLLFSIGVLHQNTMK